jgi:hypothetical protein
MNKKLFCAITALVCLAFAMTAFAGGAPSRSVSGTIYQGGASALATTEGLFSGCLKNIFSAFNPCLDMVRGCSDTVFSPLDRGVGYVERKIHKPRYIKRRVKPQSLKKEKPANEAGGGGKNNASDKEQTQEQAAQSDNKQETK